MTTTRGLPTGPSTDQMADLLDTPLSDRERAFLDARTTALSASHDPDWRDAWNTVVHLPTAAAHATARDLHDHVWIPRLEGRAGAVALWGAVLALALADALAPHQRASLTGPWTDLARAHRNIFGDGSI